MQGKVFLAMVLLSSGGALQSAHGAPSPFLGGSGKLYSPRTLASTPLVNEDTPTASRKRVAGDHFLVPLAAADDSLTVSGSPFIPKQLNMTTPVTGDKHYPGAQAPAEKVRWVSIEARVACFVAQDRRLKQIYGNQGYPEYELEAATALFRVPKCECFSNKSECEPHWMAFGNWSFYERKGRSTCTESSTHMTNNAVNFGVKYYFTHFDGYRPYFGLGIGFAHVRFHDHSSAVRGHVDKWGPALLVKSGVECDLTCNLYADVFIDYGSNWFSSAHSKHCTRTRGINTGGGKFGAGLGYRF